MKCHYEILNVSKTADESEIKTAYKKLALKWHPDKNLDNVEYAKEQFQLVQQAYEVLSDRQERAWYDKHRDQILAKSNSSLQENNLDVYQYFTSTCYKGFDDDEDGFYSVYRNVFEQIAKEDLEFMDNKDEFISIPNFGHSYSSYEDVVGPFYSYWLGYCTKKSYVWLDPYDIENARERRLSKLIDKENKKVRQKAKKERNEEVRALVAFVKKRDKRMQSYVKQLEARNMENRQKQEQLSKQKRLERKKELNSTKDEAEWTKFHNVKKELEEIEKNLNEEFGDETDEEDDDNLYCVACNKIFKTSKAFGNHESSKKHKENVQKLKMTMDEEEEEVGGNSSIGSMELSDDHTDMNDISDVENTNGVNLSEDNKEEQEEINEDVNEKKKKKKRKSCIRQRIPSENVEDIVVAEMMSEAESDFDFNINKKSKRNKRKGAIKQNNNETNDKAKSKENMIEAQNDEIVEKEKPSSPDVDEDKDKVTVKDCARMDTEHMCATCKSSFQSKNKLFAHLKKTGHSVYLPSSSAATKTTTSTNVKKKKSK